MPLFILSILFQVAFVLHVLKTGRNTTWIWIIVMLPMAGAIAYFILEVFPDLSQSRAGKNAGRKVQSIINPNKQLNSAVQQLAISGSVENTLRLAQECYHKGLFSEAKELYQKCLTGPHADDPHLLFGLAQANFALGQFNDVKAGLDKLIELNPSYKNPDAHLLYARALEALEETTAAQHEYETLHSYYPGPDASFYYGKFLQAQNQRDNAQAVFQHVLTKAQNSGKHYQTMHKEVLKQVKAAQKP